MKNWYQFLTAREKKGTTTSHISYQYLTLCEKYANFIYACSIYLDFSLTVKAATLIFISGRDSAISSAKEGESGFIYNLVKINKLCWPQTCVHFTKILTLYTLNSHLLTLKAHNHKMYAFRRPLKYVKPHRQTVWTQIRLLP